MGNPRNFRLQHWLACLSDRGHSAFTLLLFLGLMLLIYGSYAIIARPIQDDWWILAEARARPRFTDLLQYWFHTVAHRPVYAVLLSATSYAFGSNVWAFALLTSTFWWAAALVAAHGLRWSQPAEMRWCFALTASLPFIAASAVCAGVQMIAQTFSLFLWACSFALQMNALRRGRMALYLCSFVLATASLLTYEAVLPLVFFNVAFSALEATRLNPAGRPFGAGNLLTVVAKTLPQWCALFVVFAYKIAMSLSADAFLLKVEQRSWAERFLSLADWFAGLVVGQPLAFFSILFSSASAQVLQTAGFWAGLVILFMFYVSVFRPRAGSRTRQMSTAMPLLISAGLGVLSSSLIFSISGYSARVEGLASRLWIGVWVLLSLPIGMAMAAAGPRRWGATACALLSGVFMLSLLAQMEAYSRAGRVAETITHDLHQKAASHDYAPGDSILAIAPRYTPDNVNNEPVFEDVFLQYAMIATYPEIPWHIFSAFYPINWVTADTNIPKGHFDESFLKWDEDGLTAYRFLGMVWSNESPKHIWLYTFNLRNGTSTFERISSSAELERIVGNLNRSAINQHPKTLSERLRDNIKRSINQFITLDRFTPPTE